MNRNQPLYEKYRPAQWSDVIGQAKTVKTLEALPDFGARAFWISGESGTGKTTIARIIAGQIAEPFFVEELDATGLTPAALHELERAMQMYGFGKGGRAYIVNEAHGLRQDTIRQLLVLLERLPSHVVFIFTTTCDGQDKLFEGAIDAHPLLSRCIPLGLARRDLAKAFAARCREIADAEGLNGRPIADYVKLAQKHRNNFRAMLQDIEAGAMKGGN